jgi:hypothetical protein
MVVDAQYNFIYNSYVKKFLLFLLLISVMPIPSFCVRVDGKYWEWENVPEFYKCRPRVFARDRSGLDLRAIKILGGNKHIYMLIEGRSMTGVKADKGQGFRRTSLRISFNSTASPLNRARILIDPNFPNKIKISMPSVPSFYVGTKKDRYWASGKYGTVCFFEIKIPIVYDKKGAHIGRYNGPLVKLSPKYAGSRESLSDVLINSVDVLSHRLVDTATFRIKSGSI